jgi:6-phosphogluconolactonase
MKKGQLLIVDQPTLIAQVAAERIEAALAQAVRERGRATLALSGGSTPRPLHRLLAERNRIDWAHLDLYFSDERCVPPDDPESNYGAALTDLLEQLPGALPRVFRPEGEATDREAAAARYAAKLPERFDMILLGMGADGHTASLFPGDAVAVGEQQRRALFVKGPKAPHERITLSPPVFAAARNLIVLVQGSDKALALARALEGTFEPLRCPMQLIRQATFIVDRSAATELSAGTLQAAGAA